MAIVLDQEKCQRRNKVAALRYGVNAVPIKFREHNSIAIETTTAQNVQETFGSLPRDDSEAMERINALQPLGATKLTREDVYIHYAEAANDNFIGDRFMFMDRSTLRNIAAGGEAGVAFMNSHRTGGMSEATELPYGRTFAGRYERFRNAEGQLRQRTILGIYMGKGRHPNGVLSTDEIDAGINDGTISDVSVGLHGGNILCDLCGDKDPRDGACTHYPGTTRNLTEEQVESQKNRGATNGVASYTLYEAGLSELSAVYSGAVPGAGFQKAHRFAKQNGWMLSGVFADQLSAAYGELGLDEDLTTPDGVAGLLESAFTRALEKTGFRADPAAQYDDPHAEDAAITVATVEPVEEQTEETMPEEKAPTQDVAAALAEMREQITKLNSELSETRTQLSQEREKSIELHQRDLRNSVYTEIGDDWYGERDEHADHIMDLMASFPGGLDSPQVQQYLKINRAFAEHLETSEVYSSKGDPRPSPKGQSAEAQLQALALKLTKEDGLNRRDAFEAACRANPDLFERHRRETAVRG